MAHVEKDEYYSLFFALQHHRTGDAPIAGLKLHEELDEVVGRLKADDYKRPPAEAHALTEEQIRKTVRHVDKCPDCRLAVCEDGPFAERVKSDEDLEVEAAEQEVEERRLTRKFWVSVVYGFGFFAAARWAILEYYEDTRGDPVADEHAIEAVNDTLQIHPMLFVFGFFVLVAAWGITDAWRIANYLWLDWNRAKEAVPVIGRKWAAKSRAKEKTL